MVEPRQKRGEAGATQPDVVNAWDAATLFDSTSVTELTGVRIFDVGQGDCLGLLDQNGRVFCYVDYGGLQDHPDEHVPSPQQMTAARQPVRRGNGYAGIILTHWDKDHYWSANKKNPEAQKCKWLVPRQMASMTAVRFAARLLKARCWPEKLGPKTVQILVGSTYAIELRKCRGFVSGNQSEDRNLSGLAIFLLRFLNRKIEACMLLPGDCAFHAIPNRPNAPLRGLIAYHHGSHTHWGVATASAIAQRAPKYQLFYSYGTSNGYGHPDRTNYRPAWDANAKSTDSLRKTGRRYADIVW
jgi:hypothetical protein